MITFTNIKKSSMKLSLDYRYGAGRVTIAGLIPGVKVEGRPQKGDRIFDWENALTIAIFPYEAADILEWIDNGMENKYTLSHSPNADFNTSISVLGLKYDNGYLSVGVGKKVGNDKKYITYGLNNVGIRMFRMWLEAVAGIDIEADKLRYITYQVKELFQKNGGVNDKNSGNNKVENSKNVVDDYDEWIE